MRTSCSPTWVVMTSAVGVVVSTVKSSVVWVVSSIQSPLALST